MINRPGGNSLERPASADAGRTIPARPYRIIAVMTATLWAAAVLVFDGKPVALGACLLAYTLGARHAVDADHIEAIDAATRKFASERQDAGKTGLFFSIGHSIVVLAMTVALVAIGPDAAHFLARATGVGAALGGLASILFLLSIGAWNLAAAHRLRPADVASQPQAVPLVFAGGLIFRIITPVLRRVSRPWHMIAVGFLFGLGFYTASEIGLLGLSVQQTKERVAPVLILIFPLLFAAAMALVDLLDSEMMARANPVGAPNGRRARNVGPMLMWTSAVVALCVALVELNSWVPMGRASVWLRAFSDHSEIVGLSIIALFAVMIFGSRVGASVRGGTV